MRQRNFCTLPAFIKAMQQFERQGLADDGDSTDDTEVMPGDERTATSPFFGEGLPSERPGRRRSLSLGAFYEGMAGGFDENDDNSDHDYAPHGGGLLLKGVRRQLSLEPWLWHELSGHRKVYQGSCQRATPSLHKCFRAEHACRT